MSPVMLVAATLVLWLVGAVALLAFVYRRTLALRWREPVLCAPVLILESDDWGYGPSRQSQALDQIVEALAAIRDRRGRHPVMTVSIVLAGPDTHRIRADECRRYHRVTLADPRFEPVRNSLARGVARGVFALQLHGMEHYWPDCLIRAAAQSGELRDWLSGPEFPSTETLPPRLQSRWIDATTLPSSPLPDAQVAAAAIEETATFATIFGALPEVAVPPTFIWPRNVEAAWARGGVRIVVTPGIRYECRDGEGRPVPVEWGYFNAAAGPHGITYIVRNDYFEPALGHSHQRALEALDRNSRLGRPTLLEMHRANFIGDDRARQRAIDETTRLLQEARARFPDIRFMSTAELARNCQERTDLVTASAGTRLHFLLRRLREVSRLRKLAWATGAALPAFFAYLITAPFAYRHTSE